MICYSKEKAQFSPEPMESYIWYSWSYIYKVIVVDLSNTYNFSSEQKKPTYTDKLIESTHIFDFLLKV